MRIFEVKNNLVKASYDTTQETLVLSGFVVIKDVNQSFIGQIVHLEANAQGNFAIVKLLFTFDDQGVISGYNGSVPGHDCAMDIVSSEELLELLPIKNPLLLGELAQQKMNLTLDRSFLENKLLVCCENQAEKDLFIKNIALQLINDGQKVLVFDLNGELDFSDNKIVAGNDFKLPLNYESINFIYNHLEDASAETKALIQEVFLEVQEYVKSLPEKFIPFETFKNVVDSQYEEMELTELLLLKNKLLKYYEEGYFAQERSEFDSLDDSLARPEATIFDLSQIDEPIQREMISYAYNLAQQNQKQVYVFLNLTDLNSDKKLLKQVLMTKNVYSTMICSFAYKYINELKQLAKNSAFFAPIQQQSDFASYNTFLNKLNSNEFIVYGQSTQNMPLIVKLDKNFADAVDFLQEETQTVDVSEEEEPTQEELLDDEIRKDVDELFTASAKPLPRPVVSQEVYAEDEFSDEDLDFIDDLGIVDESGLVAEEQVVEEEISDNDLETAFDEFVDEETFEQDEFEGPIYEDVETQQESVEEEVFEQEIYEEEPVVENVSEVDEIPEDFEEENDQDSFTEVLNQQAQTFGQDREAPVLDILPASMSSTPIVPIYSADVEPKVLSDSVSQGDTVVHPKYGKGVVEKLISYGSKTLCSINFDNVGRRLLDPNLAELKKV